MVPGAMPRVALLTHSVNPRGGVVHTLELAAALHRQGAQVTVMAPAEPGQRFFRDLPCAVRLVPLEPCRGSLRERVGARIAAYLGHLRQAADLDRFDVLHAQDGIGANALAQLRAESRIPGFLRTVHHLDDFDDPQMALWQRRGWQDAARCLCVSEGWCERLRPLLAEPPLRVHNGVDTQRFQPGPDAADAALALRLGLAPGAGPVLLAVGGVEQRKNTLRILEAFVLLRARLPGARLVVAGGASLLDHDSYARAFTQALARHGLRTGAGGAVQLTGTLAEADMPALYRLADALLMPSLVEGFGLVVLEALASGTPVVVSRCAPFTEYLDDTVCHWADPLDAGSITRAAAAALAAPSGHALRTLAWPVLARHGWAASAREHLRIYLRHAHTAATH